MVNPKSLENLIPGSMRSHEENVANGRKGGIKSAVTRRRRRELVSLIIRIAFDTDVEFLSETDFENMFDPLLMGEYDNMLDNASWQQSQSGCNEIANGEESKDQYG